MEMAWEQSATKGHDPAAVAVWVDVYGPCTNKVQMEIPGLGYLLCPFRYLSDCFSELAPPINSCSTQRAGLVPCWTYLLLAAALVRADSSHIIWLAQESWSR